MFLCVKLARKEDIGLNVVSVKLGWDKFRAQDRHGAKKIRDGSLYLRQ
jgi:hypothetical protein